MADPVPPPPGMPERHATRCAYLRVTLAARPDDGLRNLCRHIIREGRDCTGPFLEEAATDCGLWEPAPAR